MSKKFFGKTKKGEEVSLYTISNSHGMKAELLDFGAIVRALYVPDSKGVVRDVVLGFDELAPYEENPSFFGAVIAPNANRIGGAKFTIDGVEYHPEDNDGGNNLHSNYANGAHKRVWEAKESGNSVTFSIKLADMDMGFPGNKVITVTYTLTEDNELKLHYTGTSDKNTLINPTNHSYFNLSGHDGGTIVKDVVTFFASNYTLVSKGAIPTGDIVPVKGTVMDFTSGRVIADDIDADFEQLKLTKGYDHNFAIDGYDGKLKKVAVVEDKETGLTMTVSTDLPGLQFYAGNCITPQVGKGGVKYGVRDGLCLETQVFPDAINHDNFPECVFGPGKDYDSTTIYAFK